MVLLRGQSAKNGMFTHPFDAKLAMLLFLKEERGSNSERKAISKLAAFVFWRHYTRSDGRTAQLETFRHRNREQM